VVGDLPRELFLREPSLKKRHEIETAGAEKLEREDRAVAVLPGRTSSLTEVALTAALVSGRPLRVIS
jgi:hypothetical protein